MHLRLHRSVLGGAGRTASAAPITATPPPPPFGDVPGDAEDGAMTAAIAPRKQARYRQEKQGSRRNRVVPLPPELQDPAPPIPDSPPYSPPPYSSDDEAEGSTGDFNIGGPSISSTNDSPSASESDNYFTLTLLRAGQAVPSTSGG
ncbi:hypothetical protein CYMTET_35783 [Cymbomonas tetramitiformis]|uniref:Uncharacterized protein n=1 Tax=Cymbomonas tetramitiformis TaxID=36881 RepID=A0AAE0F8I4_9CHLO|nr:hypothetical protein CYMTET_35783 [Cymbomonas tetramitiformis]